MIVLSVGLRTCKFTLQNNSETLSSVDVNVQKKSNECQVDYLVNSATGENHVVQFLSQYSDFKIFFI